MSNTKDIEEVVEEFRTKFSYGGFGGLIPQHRDGGQILMREVTDYIRTTLTSLTQHHEAEVERAHERGCKQGKFKKEMNKTYGNSTNQ